ncbi:hypothetical protein SISSUDRAFT_390245 [Sistotremastrum suecicum HHB10207 ss-3]|uniref:Uncharacterized protein n=1 Tax=Sistotremastrum suecicum HHB10207 ss-3 TaxID=1314776 RepID=A0A165YWV0_9AGAM|nr:hypothetical protein SISSUDRAFT_390245 [Sistotremastrum suecicum HHB10207 ss-3]
MTSWAFNEYLFLLAFSLNYHPAIDGEECLALMSIDYSVMDQAAHRLVDQIAVDTSFHEWQRRRVSYLVVSDCQRTSGVSYGDLMDRILPWLPHVVAAQHCPWTCCYRYEVDTH